MENNLKVAHSGSNVSLPLPLSLSQNQPQMKSTNSLNNLSSPLTQLHEAATRNQLSDLMRLLDQGSVDVNQVDPSYKWTALHLAARNGHSRMCSELLSRGAKIDARDAMGQTPLHRAAYWDHSSVAELLLSHGADFTIMDKMGQTPGELAIQGHSTKCFNLIRVCYVQLEMNPHLLKHSSEKIIIMKRNVEEKEKIEKEFSMAKKRQVKAAKERKKFYQKEMELMEERERLQQKLEMAKKDLSSLNLVQQKTKKDVSKEKKLQQKMSKYQTEIEKKEVKIAYNRRSSLENTDVKNKAEV